MHQVMCVQGSRPSETPAQYQIRHLVTRLVQSKHRLPTFWPSPSLLPLDKHPSLSFQWLPLQVLTLHRTHRAQSFKESRPVVPFGDSMDDGHHGPLPLEGQELRHGSQQPHGLEHPHDVRWQSTHHLVFLSLLHILAHRSGSCPPLCGCGLCCLFIYLFAITFRLQFPFPPLFQVPPLSFFLF